MAGEITTEQLADGALSADANGRAKIADDYFTATEVAAKFAANGMVPRSRGAAMCNRIRLQAQPAATETVTIGADVYEYNANTPPAGGTAGRIWVYRGANAAAARANLVNAINNVVDAANITYDGVVSEAFVADEIGVRVRIQSSDAVGSSTVTASATATATTDTVVGAGDDWDDATCYGGLAEGGQLGFTRVQIVAGHIGSGSLRISFPFTAVGFVLTNWDRDEMDEDSTLTGGDVELTLAGGAAPNVQVGDIIGILAWGA